MVHRLNQEIIRELIQGAATLLPGNKYRVRTSCMALLSKPVSTRKGWLMNVQSARQRFQRLQQHNAELGTLSQEASTLIEWMRTSRTR